jgi:hypothetical protein
LFQPALDVGRYSVFVFNQQYAHVNSIR